MWLALNQHLSQLDNLLVAFNMKQKRSTTLKMESYLCLWSQKIAAVDEREDNPVVAAVQAKQDAMMEMLQAMMRRMDRLEKHVHPKSNPTTLTASPNVCHKCGQPGHFAHGCANPQRPNRAPTEDAVVMVPKNCSYIVLGTLEGIPILGGNFLRDNQYSLEIGC